MYEILFENEYLMVVKKPQGFVCQPDEKDESSLIEELVRDKGSEMRLCHRLDRNTGGLLLVAKSEENFDIICKAINDGRVKKYYKALVVGEMKKTEGFKCIKAYHFKDAKKSRVYIYDEPRKLSKPIITEYRTIKYNKNNDSTIIEVHLVTGRTHQIRAQFAHLGHPVCGDGKYGRNAVNKAYGLKYQALFAYKMEFEKNFAGKMKLPEKIECNVEFS